MSIDLEQLRALQKAGNVMGRGGPSNWEILDIPEDLLHAWREYVQKRVALMNLMEKYALDTEVM